MADRSHPGGGTASQSGMWPAEDDAVGPITTPATWRLAAGTILAVGLVAGFVAAASEADRWIVIGFVAMLIVGLVPILRGSRRALVTSEAFAMAASGPLPSVLVLIAGRDEAAVLPNLIADLGAQDHRTADGSARFSVTVVDDRSTDGTGAAVHAAALAAGLGSAIRVLRRDAPVVADGKGAALACARPEVSDAEVIAILDADARIGPGYLRRAAQYVAAGVPALTARRRTLHAERSHLARIQADEQSQDGELQGGRWASGGCSEFRGNGIVISRDLLRSVGGIPAASLTEDLDLSTLVAVREGVTVAWAFDLEAWEEPVPSWRGLWRQRLRWSEGAIRRLFRFGPSVLTNVRLPMRARWDFAGYGGQLVAPPLIIGAIAGGVVFHQPTLAVGLFSSYVAVGGILAFDALRWETDPRGRGLGLSERLARSVRVALFSTIWLAAVNGALWRLATRRGLVRFDKTARAAPGSTPPGETARTAGSVPR